LTAVTLAALALGGILLVCARPEEGRVEVPTVARFASAAVLAGAIVFAFVGLVGNLALSESNKAEAAENWARAETQARKATRWAPWSSEAWKNLGEVQLQTAKLGAARVSFRKALAKDPEKWDLWLDLAFASTGRAREAAARRAYELNPLSPEIAAVKPVLGLGSRK
jgi:tetratricopeptide (TPR) repeat protein